MPGPSPATARMTPSVTESSAHAQSPSRPASPTSTLILKGYCGGCFSRMPSSSSWCCSTGARRAGHRIQACLVFRERDHVPEVRFAGQQHRHAVDPERDAAVRRRAHRQRVEEEPEPIALLLGRDPQRVEHLLLHLLAMDPDRAAADLHAVAHEVVRLRERRAGIAGEQRLGSAVGAVNGWWHAAQRSPSSSHSSSGKSVTHTNRQASSSTSPSSRPRWSRS